MMGAIVGDVVGSVYEFNNIKTREFPLFSERSEFTDDTVMTVAVARAIMNGGRAEDYVRSMRGLGRLYPDAGYGGRFDRWLRTRHPRPYNSYGNGAGMRVSPVGWYYDTLKAVEAAAEISASVTHDHPEGVRGAQAVAACVFLARKGADKAEIRRCIARRHGYELDRTLDEIRPGYGFDVSCQGSVPEAIIAFLESDGFEDAVRGAVSIGGDSDTIAAMTGAVAEAAYGIPEDIRAEAWRRLDPPLRTLVGRFEELIEMKQ